MQCPDCASAMKKMGNFYTCQRCGLSFKPWEVEQARKRAKDEINELKDKTDPEAQSRKKHKDRRRYRDWYEKRTGYDD